MIGSSAVCGGGVIWVDFVQCVKSCTLLFDNMYLAVLFYFSFWLSFLLQKYSNVDIVKTTTWNAKIHQM